MIKVRINKKDKIESIIISGHACYDDFGKDIVCSAVSSIVITTVNGISEINDKYLTVNELKDKLEIIINMNDDICYKLILNMITLLKELEEQYSENITIK